MHHTRPLWNNNDQKATNVYLMIKMSKKLLEQGKHSRIEKKHAGEKAWEKRKYMAYSYNKI